MWYLYLRICIYIYITHIYIYYYIYTYIHHEHIYIYIYNIHKCVYRYTFVYAYVQQPPEKIENANHHQCSRMLCVFSFGVTMYMYTYGIYIYRHKAEWFKYIFRVKRLVVVESCPTSHGKGWFPIDGDWYLWKNIELNSGYSRKTTFDCWRPKDFWPSKLMIYLFIERFASTSLRISEEEFG